MATTRKQKEGNTGKSRPSKSRTEAKGKAKPDGAKARKPSSAHDGGTGSAGSVSARSDQIAALLGKTVNLLETGIDLGINLMGRLGDLARDQIAEKLTGRPGTGSQGGPAEETGSGSGPLRREEPGAGPESPQPAASLGVVNRLPLFPGSQVHVSFSINNDTSSSHKKLRLGVEGFIGASQNAILDGKRFLVKPSNAVIAPMDFEKFVLTGEIPPETSEDSYGGWIVVTGEEGFRIPITLVVSAKP
jgi:hypothetical protein